MTTTASTARINMNNRAPAANLTVSIIIPVFNKCDLTMQCLEAIPAVTTRVPHEILVVDNASSDSTPKRLAELKQPNLRVLRNDINRGFAGACNQGAAAAHGKYLLFLNNDTIPVQGWLEALVEEMRTHPEVAAVGAKLLYETTLVQHAGVAFGRETRSPFHPHRLLRMDDPRVNIRRELQAVTAACVLIRPKWFQECGGFKEDYRNGYEDLDLCLEIRKRGGVIVYQPKSVVIHLESQTPGRMKYDNENRALFFQRWQHAILADEDAYYFEGGLRSLGRMDLRTEEPRLARIQSDAERRQWRTVAECQRAAAAYQTDVVRAKLAAVQTWPDDAAVRRWAGAVCLHMHLPELAQQHFAAVLALADSPELRVQMENASIGSRPTVKWEAMARAGWQALRKGDWTTAQTALETALLRGAPPRLVLPGWQQAARLSENPDAATIRQALLALPRVDMLTAKSLATLPEKEISPKKPAALANPPAEEVAAEPPAPLVSIIVLALNQLEHTRNCVESLMAHTHSPYEVILVDNGSTDGTSAYFEQLRSQHPQFKIITNRTNRGFAAGNNQALAIAQGEFLVLLNNDTIVTPGWLEGFRAVWDVDPAVGLVGPVSNRVSGPQQISVPYTTASAEAVAAFAKLWTRDNALRTQPVGRLVGFCLGFRRSVLEAIGGLDETFGSGNFEDDDFCIRARLAGFESRIAFGVFIHHTGSQTFKGANIDYRTAMLRNWEYFRTKWQLPSQASLERGYPMPTAKPEGLRLQVSLPDLKATHAEEGPSHWRERALESRSQSCTTTPAVAALGNLKAGRTFLDGRKLEAAWKATVEAIVLRPFHPEGYLLLAEISMEAGDGASARHCAQRARDLAPNWKQPRQFLQKNLKTAATPEWLRLPGGCGGDTKHSNRLSVCVITRNEEEFLSQCLNSVKSIADQIVVLDTGSTDNTLTIARQFGVEVHTFEWCDDFSAARNAALEHLRGDWILMLDADEELPADQHAKLRADMANPSALAYRVPLVNHGEEIQGRSFIPRLFRNTPGAYYYGRIHEQVFPSLLAGCKAWGFETRLGTAQLLHHGYAKEVVHSRNKVERNLKLLRLANLERPGEPNLVMNLGLELVRSGDLASGLVHYREAFRLMSALPPQDVVPELREVLLTQFTSHLYKIRAHEEILQVLHSPLAKNGGLTASLHFAMGLAHFEMGQSGEAAEQMRLCLKQRNSPCLSPINTDTLTAAPHHCLALSLAKLNDVSGAEQAFQAGLKESGRTEEVKLDYARLLAATKRPVEALHLAHEVVTTNPRSLPAWRLGGEIATSQASFVEFALDWTSEALKAMPEDLSLEQLRAEALLLSQQTAAALGLWHALAGAERSPRTMAAEIICAVVQGHPCTSPKDDAEQVAVSRAFVDWYRRLVNFGAQNVIAALNSRVPSLRRLLPGAADLVEAVLVEAGRSEELALA